MEEEKTTALATVAKYKVGNQELFGNHSLGLIITRPHLNIKTVFPRYGDSHAKNKMVSKPSYL